MGIGLVKIAWCQGDFCQESLTKLQKLVDNRVVLILIIMAKMRMAALAAGLGAAMAGGPDEAHAQATEIMIPLESGEEIVMNVAAVQLETQQAVFDYLRTCIAAAEKSRSECIAEAATFMATENLDGVVRETHRRLQPLEDVIGLTVEELIQEPVFCEYAPDDSSQQACATGTEAVQLAALDLQIAEVRERRIAAETREAEIDNQIASAETRVAIKAKHLEEVEARELQIDENINETEIREAKLD
ncbi:MAG: hypothetical protein ACPGVJ_11970, partial [Mangrovicoccus sp.]